MFFLVKKEEFVWIRLEYFIESRAGVDFRVIQFRFDGMKEKEKYLKFNED